jgi:hypothetical protein
MMQRRKNNIGDKLFESAGQIFNVQLALEMSESRMILGKDPAARIGNHQRRIIDPMILIVLEQDLVAAGRAEIDNQAPGRGLET